MDGVTRKTRRIKRKLKASVETITKHFHMVVCNFYFRGCIVNVELCCDLFQVHIITGCTSIKYVKKRKEYSNVVATSVYC